MRNAVELKQMATSRLGKQVVDLIDVTQIFAKSQGEQPVTPTDDTAADQVPRLLLSDRYRAPPYTRSRA